MTTASKNPSYPTSDYASGAAAGETLDRAMQGVRQAGERLSEKAGAAADQVKAGLDEATETLGARFDDLNALQEEWLASMRGYVREHPLATVAVAVAVGALLAKTMSRR